MMEDIFVKLHGYSHICWISHLFKSATCVKAPALNIPDQFLNDFVLYKSATFTWQCKLSFVW